MWQVEIICQTSVASQGVTRLHRAAIVPFPEDPPSPPPASKSPPLFRFSLLTLLSITTLAGFVSAIVFSKHWDPDERLLLAFWCAGLILGVSVGKWRGSQGIVSGAVGAATGCLLAATLTMNGVIPLGEQAGRPDRPGQIYLAFVIAVGCVAALGLASFFQFFSGGGFARLWSSPRLRRTILIAVGVLLIGFICFQAAWPRPWQPRWEFELGNTWPEDYPDTHLSPRGDFLFTNQSDGRALRFDNINLRFQFTDRGVVREKLPARSVGLMSVPSPNGEQLVDHFLSTAFVFNRQAQDAVHSWELDNHITQKNFNTAGDRLLVTTNTPRIQRLYVIDWTQAKLPKAELFPFAGVLLLDPTGEVLVKLFDAVEETGERTAEVARRSDGEVLGRITGIPTVGITDSARLCIAPGGEYLSLNDRVWKRTGEAPLAMPGTVIGFTHDRRALIFCELKTGEHLQFIPAWLRPLPVIRHWFDGHESGEFQIVDLENGETLNKSASFPRMILADCAQQGTVVLGKTFPRAHIRVWKVPER